MLRGYRGKDEQENTATTDLLAKEIERFARLFSTDNLAGAA